MSHADIISAVQEVFLFFVFPFFCFFLACNSSFWSGPHVSAGSDCRDHDTEVPLLRLTAAAAGAGVSM